MGKRKADKITKTSSFPKEKDEAKLNQKKVSENKPKANSINNYELKNPFLKRIFLFNNKDAFKCQICSNSSSSIKKRI